MGLRLKDFSKKHMEELKIIKSYLQKVEVSLNSGIPARTLAITAKWLHNEPHGIKAVGPSGKGMAVSRLYFYLEEAHQQILILTLGTKKNKSEQQRDINKSFEILQRYKTSQKGISP